MAFTIYADADLYRDALEVENPTVTGMVGKYPAACHMIVRFDDVILSFTNTFGLGWSLRERKVNNQRVSGRYGTCQSDDQDALSEFYKTARIVTREES